MFKNFLFRKNRKNLYIGAVIFFAGFLILIFIINWQKRTLIKKEKEAAAVELKYLSHSFADELSKKISNLNALSNFVRTQLTTNDHITEKEFNIFIRDIYHPNDGVRNYSIAPAGKISMIYPLQGNEPVIGIDLSTDNRPGQKEDHLRSVKSNKIIVSRPFNLVQGGTGISVRKALQKDGEHWGFVLMIIDLPEFLYNNKLPNDSKLQIAFRTDDGDVFAGESKVFEKDPVLDKINLPYGSWTIAGIYGNGWEENIRGPYITYFSSGVIIVLLFSFLVYVLLQYETEMKSDLKQRMLEFEESELRFKSLFHWNDIFMSIVEVTENDFVFQVPNQKLAEYFHSDIFSLPKLTSKELGLSDKVRMKYHSQFIKCTKEKKAFQFEFEDIYHKRWFKVNLFPFGRKNLISLIAIEITDLKETEHHLKETNEKLSTTLRSIGDAVIVTDERGKVTLMNTVAESLSGYMLEEAKGKDVTEILNIYNDITGAPAKNPIQKVIKEGKLAELSKNTILISRNNRKYQISDSAAPVKNDKGKVFGVVMVFRDITSQHKNEVALRESEYRLKQAQLVGHLGNWELDMKKDLYWLSEEALRILGLSLKRPVMRLDDTLHIFMDEDDQRRREAVRLLVEENKPMDEDFTIVREDDGVNRIINLRAEKLKDLYGKSDKIVGTIQDITEQKKYEEELKLRNLELSNFVYKVSHDLRAPLASIEGLINLIRLQSESTPQMLDLIENRVFKLDYFIRDILSHSKNLYTEVNVQCIDFQNIISQCFGELNYLTNSGKIRKKVSVNGSVNFCSDKERLQEIFRNFISNAIKYIDTSKSENFIFVDVRIKDKQAEIVVEDNGTGISEEILPKIFDMFYRGNERSDGSGLGLYIVQQAVNKIGGTISVKSKVNEGTKFFVTIPNLS